MLLHLSAHQVALRGVPEDPAAVPVAAAVNGNGNGKAAAADLPPLLPLEKVPQLPQVRARECGGDCPTS